MNDSNGTTGPILVHEKPGKKAYCTCGFSTNIPYCDGAHKGMGSDPLIIEVTEERTVKLCRCGYTRTFPYCDGTHHTLS